MPRALPVWVRPPQRPPRAMPFSSRCCRPSASALLYAMRGGPRHFVPASPGRHAGNCAIGKAFNLHGPVSRSRCIEGTQAGQVPKVMPHGVKAASGGLSLRNPRQPAIRYPPAQIGSSSEPASSVREVPSRSVDVSLPVCGGTVFTGSIGMGWSSGVSSQAAGWNAKPSAASGSMTLVSENFTSAAVTGFPAENVRSARSWKVWVTPASRVVLGSRFYRVGSLPVGLTKGSEGEQW